MNKWRNLTYHELQAIGCPLLEKYGLHDWRISIENLHNINVYGLQCISLGLEGLCDSENKMIRISSRMRRSFRQTLLHEIAHALAPDNKAHDEEWLEIAREIGCTLSHLQRYYFALYKVHPGQISSDRPRAALVEKR